MKHSRLAVVLFGLSAFGIPVMAADIEDYAGLPIDEGETATGPAEIVVDEQHLGYDGLPVTQVVMPSKKVEFSAVEAGYDGLPLINPQAQETATAQKQ